LMLSTLHCMLASAAFVSHVVMYHTVMFTVSLCQVVAKLVVMSWLWFCSICCGLVSSFFIFRHRSQKCQGCLVGSRLFLLVLRSLTTSLTREQWRSAGSFCQHLQMLYLTGCFQFSCCTTVTAIATGVGVSIKGAASVVKIDFLWWFAFLRQNCQLISNQQYLISKI